MNIKQQFISNGVILCRKFDEKYQVMLVKRRYTYAFADFVFGKYDHRDKYISAARLFAEMTLDELFIIATLDFNIMWYHIWLVPNDGSKFIMKKKAFCDLFLAHDGGAKLTSVILNTVVAEDPILWGLPKGRADQSETPINCAVRELREEANIDKSDYTITDSTVSVIIDNDYTKYKQMYYIAYMNKNDITQRQLRLADRKRGHIAEISHWGWYNVEDVRRMVEPRVSSAITRAVSRVKRIRRIA